MWSPDTVAALRTGGRLDDWHPEFPQTLDVDLLGSWVDGDPWSPRAIVSVRSGLVTGSIGFRSSAAGEQDLAYGMVPAVRGHGAITEALVGLLAAVAELDQQPTLTATIEPADKRALRGLTRLGFTGMRASPEGDRLTLVHGRIGR